MDTELSQAETTSEKDKPVLMTVGHVGHRSMWPELAERFNIIFLHTQAANLARDLDVSVADFESVLSPDVEGYAKNRSLWLDLNIMDAILDGRLDLGGAIEPLDKEHIGQWLPTFTYDQIAGVLVRIQLAQTIYDDLGVAGILLHEDVTPEGRTLAAWGRHLGIPVLHLPHANHFIGPGTDDVHCQIHSDFIGARGAYMRDWYIECGARAVDIAMIGAPQWDELYTDKMPDKAHAKQALGFKPDDMVLAYGTTWAQDTNVWGGPKDVDNGFMTMLAAAQEMKAGLIVKQHPGEAQARDKFYGTALEKAGVKGCVTRSHNEYVLRAADCLITQASSNIAVSAMILGAPVVELWQPGTRYPYGIKGTWGEGLPDLITDAIAAGPDEQWARDMNYDGDGKATDRAVAWIVEKCVP